MNIKTVILLLLMGMGASAVPAAAAYPLRQEILDWLEKFATATTRDAAMGAISSEDVEKLSPYLPPGLIEEFAFTELHMEVVGTQTYAPHDIYQRVTMQYVGQATLATDGGLENYAAGLPFNHEQILAATLDEAGLMVAWNNIHRWQYNGYKTDELVMNYMRPISAGASGTLLEGFSGGGHIDRYISQSYYRVYLSHLASRAGNDFRVDTDDSDRLYWKDYMEYWEPFDLKGTKFIIERSIDPHEGDQVNSYLPKERRVRRLSARERADSFLGSNYSLDDFEGFSGQVLDFDWTYLGRKAILSVSNSRESPARFHGPYSRLPEDRWQIRQCFVVEHRPKWTGHPISSKIMFVDEETYNVVLALIFDHDDALWKSIVMMYRRPGDAADQSLPENTLSYWSASVAVNYKENDATVTRAIEPVTFPKFEATQIRRMFSVSNLTGGR